MLVTVLIDCARSGTVAQMPTTTAASWCDGRVMWMEMFGDEKKWNPRLRTSFLLSKH